MKKILVFSAMMMNVAVLSTQAAETLSAALSDGSAVSVRQEACYDPATKRLGPCYLLVQPEEKANDACCDRNGRHCGC